MNSSTRIYKVTNVGQHRFREGIVGALALSTKGGGLKESFYHRWTLPTDPHLSHGETAHCRIQVLRNTKHTSKLNTTCKVNDNIRIELEDPQRLSPDGSMLVDWRQTIMYNVITPYGVVLQVYPSDTRGRINRNTTTKGVITCLLSFIGRCGTHASK